MLSTATFLSLALRCAASVHPDTSQDVARIESGFNPYAIGVVNGKSIYPASLSEALEHVSQLRAKGKNFSIGLMQINQSNFKKYGVTPAQLFDPCTNLSVYEKIIADCYLRGGTLRRALSCYYSGDYITGQKKESQFSGTSYTGRIGYNESGKEKYIVPSTKEERQQSADVVPLTEKSRRVWPKAVVRGAISTPVQSPSGTSRVLYPANVMRGKLITSDSQAKEINK